LISSYCWDENGDWLGTRSDLWIQVQNEFNNNSQVAMARAQQEIYLINKNNT
jgi:hypothetical protein